MERLTKRDEFGNANIIGVESSDLQLNLGFEELNKVTAALNKLAEYEDLEEKGKLIKSFVEIGGMLYRPDGRPGKTTSYCIERIMVCDSGVYAISQSGSAFHEKRIGKDAFFTKEGAKRASEKK